MLTGPLKRQYQLQSSAIKFARETGDFTLAELLISDRAKTIRSDSQSRTANNGNDSAIVGARAGISTANKSIARRSSLFSRLIDKLTAGIKRFVSKRREKRNRVEQHFEPITHWISKQQSVNADVHRAYKGLKEQIEQTSLKKERRRIRMTINLQCFDLTERSENLGGLPPC